MTDLDRLLRSDISLAAAHAAKVPDFAPIEGRGVRRRRTRSLLAAAVAVVAVLVAVEASPRMLGAQNDTITPAVQPTPQPMPSGDAELAAGTYLAGTDESSVVDYTLTFPAGWDVQGGNEYYLEQDAPGGIGILPFLVDEIYADACRGDRGGVTKVRPRPQDLVDALRAQPGPVKSSPVQTTLGGFPATRIDLRLPPSLRTRDCFLGPGSGVQLWLSKPHRYLVLGSESVVSVYVVDVLGQRQVFTAQYDPVRTSRAHRAELQQILDSLRLEAPRR